jgi:hypothetical protein
VAELLPCMQEALDPIPRTTKENRDFKSHSSPQLKSRSVESLEFIKKILVNMAFVKCS